MLTSGDVVELDLGAPHHDAARLRPEVPVSPDPHNGLGTDSAAQCQHVRAVATQRVRQRLGNVGSVVLAQIRGTIAVLLDV